MKEPWHFNVNFGGAAVMILLGIQSLLNPWNYHVNPPKKMSPDLGIGLIVAGVLYGSFVYIRYLRAKKRS